MTDGQPGLSSKIKNSPDYSEKGNNMIKTHIETWLNTLDMNLEQKVLAGLCLKLAESFDAEANTSTAAELRKTILELQRQLKGSAPEFDPLEKLLTR